MTVERELAKRAAELKRKAEVLAAAANRCQIAGSYDMAAVYREKALRLLDKADSFTRAAVAILKAEEPALKMVLL